jgi:hypothetical protein
MSWQSQRNEMNNELKNKILLLAEVAKPTDIQKKELIDNWEKYFNQYSIVDEHQQREFEAVMRARLISGIVSIVAPQEMK